MECCVNGQGQLGLLLAAFLFMPWKLQKEHLSLRLILGVAGFLGITEVLRLFNVNFQAQLLLYTVLLSALILFCFHCSLIHMLFVVTCSYAVQHISSKLAYMLVMPFLQRMEEENIPFLFISLFCVTALMWLLIFFSYTRPYGKKEDLKFNNGQIVIYSGIFLLVAIGLSTAIERGFDKGADTYIASYQALNAMCILFGFTILNLEIGNYNTKALEQENLVLANLLKADELRYEQARRDMDKINIRYHDLKQQYAGADEAERRKLEEEMNRLSLSYFTGNKAVDITLTQKAALCSDAGIRLICSADGSCLDRMKPFHLYSMLGNALDNAIECLEQVSDPEKKVITLDIHKERDMALIRVENYTPKVPVYDGGAIRTSKADFEDHGYGIKSIRNTAELYGGSATTFVENNIFYLLIVLNF